MTATRRLSLAGLSLAVLLALGLGATASSATSSQLIAFHQYGQCPAIGDPYGPCSEAIYLGDLTTGSVHRLAWGGDAPAWSPDGKRIAYESLDGIVVMRADGSDRRRLCTLMLCGGASPTWSPDGKRIAFTASSVAYKGLKILDTDGTHLRSVPHTDKVLLRDADWSPDGTSFVVTTSKDLIQIVDLRGHRRTLARNGERPKWSPDGKHILFAADTGRGIYVVGASGGKPVRVTSSKQRTESGTWSPDGRQVAYFSGKTLHVLTLAGRHDEIVTLRPNPCAGSYYDCFNPDWRPAR